MLSYLQQQQDDSLVLEKKKLRKLTLILSFLAIIFAVSDWLSDRQPILFLYLTLKIK